jgi:hypothetical protein
VLSRAVGGQWERLGGGRDIQVWTDDKWWRCFAALRKVKAGQRKEISMPGRTGKNALGKLTHR